MAASSLSPQEEKIARKGRTVSIVVASTMLIWIAAQFLGGRLGLPVRFVFLFDFAAIAAFFWALVVTYQIWQANKSAAPPKGE